jgi:hypothetical protein
MALFVIYKYLSLAMVMDMVMGTLAMGKTIIFKKEGISMKKYKQFDCIINFFKGFPSPNEDLSAAQRVEKIIKILTNTLSERAVYLCLHSDYKMNKLLYTTIASYRKTSDKLQEIDNILNLRIQNLNNLLRNDMRSFKESTTYIQPSLKTYNVLCARTKTLNENRIKYNVSHPQLEQLFKGVNQIVNESLIDLRAEIKTISIEHKFISILKDGFNRAMNNLWRFFGKNYHGSKSAIGEVTSDINMIESLSLSA